jgi:spore maturation protein CgeB
VLTSKTFGLEDLRRHLGFANASFLPHGFDPDIHRPAALDERDRRLFDCDVSFIGTWSLKKERIVDAIVSALPEVRLKIWGNQWGAAASHLQKFVQNREVQGIEYAKATIASRINLGLLSEIRPGASSGDLITARTFQIPATSGFMLHERTEELANYFIEDQECGCFAGPDDVAQKVKHYLAQSEKRNDVALAGYRRTQESDYSVDHRVRQMLAKYYELRGASRRVAA